MWAAVIAVDFFFLSNPLTLYPQFSDSLRIATWVTLLWALLQLPWLQLPRVPRSVLALLAWGALSLAWSIDAPQTFGYLALNAQIALLAVLVCASATAAVIGQGFALGGVAVLLVSLYEARDRLPIIDYPLSYSEHLVGVGTHRNILSYTLIFALAALLCVAPQRWFTRLAWLVTAVVITGGVVLTDSATGKLGVVVLFVVAAALHSLGKHLLSGRRLLGLGVVVLAVVPLIAFVEFDQVVQLLGRDPTRLSGRVPLWLATFRVSGDAPLTGWGWGAVWSHPWDPAAANPVSHSIGLEAHESVVHGHNSIVDLVPEVGIVGALLALAIFVVAAIQATHALRHPTADPGDRVGVRLVVLLLVAHIVCGLSEPLLETPLGWFTLVITTAVATSLRSAGRSQARADRTPPALPQSAQGGHRQEAPR